MRYGHRRAGLRQRVVPISLKNYRKMPGRCSDSPAVTKWRARCVFAAGRIGVLMLITCGGAAAAEDVGAAIASKGTPGRAPACAGCHGERGEGNAAAGFPRLAGLSVPYLRAQIAAFAGGQRDNPVMKPIAQMLGMEEAQSVSAYFAALPSPAPPVPKAAAEPGTRLATEGRWTHAIPACFSCHGPGGIGVGDAFPPLAGQPASYIAGQLRAWQAGSRPPGPLGLMGAVARRLTGADIAAVADWLTTLPGDRRK